ncbi:hypothetical protein BDZ90DRAFT_138692 [Jaminaea rosea]|uniref:Uncharacterized protein n=1 Tax=Jaminaea rosea TaxID=1569628 RepID=A0A316V0W8_9BASI|nr:hypothetical protein BDZ90DRAFT_138692 [Jaminaea rosea]PWN29085.1 hypothetical protein BDZ90DRAFT_138692 [Jaminaea rosea]
MMRCAANPPTASTIISCLRDAKRERIESHEGLYDAGALLYVRARIRMRSGKQAHQFSSHPAIWSCLDLFGCICGRLSKFDGLHSRIGGCCECET